MGDFPYDLPSSVKTVAFLGDTIKKRKAEQCLISGKAVNKKQVSKCKLKDVEDY